MRWVTIFAILSIFSSTTLLSQKKYSISGYIIDSYSKEKLTQDLHLAKVYDSKTFYGSMVDPESKRYSIRLDKGKYDLYINAQGYKLKKRSIHLDKDTVLDFFLEKKEINLEEVIVSGKVDCLCLDQSKPKKKRDFLRLRNRVIKVRLYAKALKTELNDIDNVLASLSRKSKKRKKLRNAKDELFKEYAEKVKNLYTKDGVILIKLIHRETGKTVNDLLKEYTSIWTRNKWKLVVRIHNMNPKNKTKIKLKTKYDPINNEEDCCIEKILNKPGMYLDIY